MDEAYLKENRDLVHFKVNKVLPLIGDKEQAQPEPSAPPEDAPYLPRFLGMEKALQTPNVLDHRAAPDPTKEEH